MAKQSDDATHDDGSVDYLALAEFRYALRKFQTFSEAAAATVGLTPQHHQAMLAIMGFGGRAGLAVGELAHRLLVRHNTAVELVNRLQGLGLARRATDRDDARKAAVTLTPEGKRRLRRLSHAHLTELRSIRPALRDILDAVEQIEAV